MKNRKNPLIVQDNCHGKLFFRWLFIILYIFYFILVVLMTLQDISNIGNLSPNDKDGTMTDIVLLILFSLFIFGRLLNKSARNSMIVMKHICSYDEVYEMVENQVFREVKDVGYDEIYESDLWLKLDGEFVPKNFIVSAYYISKMRGNHVVCIVLINGRECFYNSGIHMENLKNTLKKFNEMIKHGDFEHVNFWGNDNWTGGKTRKIVKERYEKYLSEGHTIQELVNNYADFTKGILDGAS